MQRRAFLLGAAATGLIPLGAQAAPLDLRARVQAWRSRWRRGSAARRRDLSLPAGDAVASMCAALEAPAVLAEIGELEVQDQVHPAVQGVLRDLVDAVEGAAATGADALAAWLAGPGRADAEAMRLQHAVRRSNGSRWVDRDAFGVGRAGSPASVRRRVRRAEQAARRLSRGSTRGLDAGAPLDPALAARIEAGRARHGAARADRLSGDGWRVAGGVLLILGGGLFIVGGIWTLAIAFFLPPVAAAGLTGVVLGVLMLFWGIAWVGAAVEWGQGPSDSEWGTLGVDPTPHVVALLPRPDFKPTGVFLGARARVLVEHVRGPQDGVLLARIGETALVVPPSGCLPRKAAGPLSLRLESPPTLEPVLVKLRLTEPGECR